MRTITNENTKRTEFKRDDFGDNHLEQESHEDYAAEIHHLSKRFGPRILFDDFDLKLKAGKLTVITGPSGSGKSTLLNILGLLEPAEQLDYQLFGKKMPTSRRQRQCSKVIREEISYVFQDFALIEDQTVEENLMTALRYVSISRSEKKKRIAKVLDDVGLAGMEQQKVYTLSGGEQQRTAIARAFLKPGRLVLADEPTGSLDQLNRDQIVSLLKKLTEMGKTVVAVSHDPWVAQQADERIDMLPNRKTPPEHSIQE